MFGGSVNKGSSLTSDISRIDLESRKWKVAGNLKNPRKAHSKVSSYLAPYFNNSLVPLLELELKVDNLRQSVIFNGEYFIVVGGSGTFKAEKCLLQNDKISCVELELTLTKYEFYPVLFTVSDDFVKNC